MKAHLRYLSYVIRHKWFVFIAGLKTGAPLWRLIVHDWSKFSPAEWGPYVRRFGQGRAGLLKKTDDPEDFHRAWTHHWHLNPHHWEHWLAFADDGTLRAMPMPDHFIREMVADWMGAGRAITGEWEAAEWYTKNTKRIQLDHRSRIKAEGLLAAHAGLRCVWGCNGGSPTYCIDELGGCEAHSAAFPRVELAGMRAARKSA